MDLWEEKGIRLRENEHTCRAYLPPPLNGRKAFLTRERYPQNDGRNAFRKERTRVSWPAGPLAGVDAQGSTRGPRYCRPIVPQLAHVAATGMLWGQEHEVLNPLEGRSAVSCRPPSRIFLGPSPCKGPLRETGLEPVTSWR